MPSASSAPVTSAAGLRSADGGASASLADYGRALARRWWVVLLGVLLGGAAAAGYLVTAHKTYQSTATVQVTATGVGDASGSAGSRSGSSNVDMDTEAQIVRSDSVARLAKARLKTELDPSALEKRVKVTVPPNSAVLSIAFDAGNAEDARAGAQAFADSYLANRTTVARAVLDSEIKTLQDQLPALNKQLQDLTGQTATLPSNSPQRAYALAQQDVVRAQIDTINAATTPLIQQPITPGQQLSPATLPGQPSSPRRVLVAASGIVAGLLLGAIFALLPFGRDRRIRRPGDLATGGRLPLLAYLPSGETKSVSLLPPTSAGAAAVRELRDRLVGGGVDSCVLVVPLSSAAGGSLVTLNLAASLSADGSRAALVCATPDSACARLSPPGALGVSDALAQEIADLRSVLMSFEDRPLLSVMLPGRQASGLLDRLHGSAMRELIQRLRGLNEHVVIEAPAWAKTRSALILGGITQSVILVAETRLTTRDEINEAYLALAEGGANVVGVVLVPRLRGGTAGSADVVASRRSPEGEAATPAAPVGVPIAAGSTVSARKSR